MHNRLLWALPALGFFACGGSSPATPTAVQAKLSITQPEKAQLCPASEPTELGAYQLLLALQLSESAGVSAELQSLMVTPFLGATGQGGTGLGDVAFIFGTGTLTGNGSLEGRVKLPLAVDVGPGSPYTVRVALAYRDANGFNLEATLDGLDVVNVASCSAS